MIAQAWSAMPNSAAASNPAPAPMPAELQNLRHLPQPDAAPEFAVPVIQAELDEVVEEPKPEAEFSVPAPTPVEPAEAESSVHEVDLSEEWAALSQQLETAMLEEPSPAAQESELPHADAEFPTPVLVPEEAAQSAADATGTNSGL